MFSSAITVFALAATALFSTPAQASSSNYTLQTRTSVTTRATCFTVAGQVYGKSYNFGCLCLEDLDDFCNNNGINDYWQSILSNYISSNGKTFSYPANAQPTCDGVGGFSCGSLNKVNGQCVTSSGSTTTVCDPSKCFSNGGCCPRGQTYSNGKCCGTVGCSNQQTCTPVTSCTTYASNNICCPSGTSGWIGQKTRCCPSGQTESSDGKSCVCPNGQSVDPSNSSKCISSCPAGTKWGTVKCCPTDATEKNGVCVCNDSNEDLSSDGKTCSPRCTNSWKWCSKAKICCPPGSDEDSNGNCVCTDKQTILNPSKTACVDRCPNGSFQTTRCCPDGATENSAKQCVCSNNQILQGNSDTGKCVSKCAPPNPVSITNSNGDFCCPSGATSVSGSCKCYDSTLTISGSSSSGYKCNKCPSGYSAGALGTCCPSGATEASKGVCTCTDPSKVITGTYPSSISCTDQCNTAGGWVYGRVKDQCCPPNSKENSAGVCECNDPGQYINGSGSSAKCTDRCDTTTQHWCQGTQPKCCPTGSSLKGSDCVCDDPNSSIQNGKCMPRCPDGQAWRTSRCCPSDASQQGNTCVCNDCFNKELSDDGTKCIPKCPSGSTFRTTKCCKNYLIEKNQQCVCPNDGDSDTGSCCQPQCPKGYYYEAGKGCKPICASGFTYRENSSGKGFCCNNNDQPCQTTCCPAPNVEVGNTGVCCPPGSTLNKDKGCVSPSPKTWGKRHEKVGQKIQLSPSSKTGQLPYGLESNKDGKLCPVGMAACPIPGRINDAEYECLDSQTDLQSCGGCASMGTGEDCTALPGARWMGCDAGKCEVYSCKAGWKKVGGRCERK